MHEKPLHFPSSRLNGEPLKPLPQVLLDRRATDHFKPDDIPDELLEAILRLGAQAPSGYNLQPWRFIVVRDAGSRERLMRAAFHQEKVGEAPVVLIAVGIRENLEATMEEVFTAAIERGIGSRATLDQYKQSAAAFLETIPSGLWLNRHTMIAFTCVMLLAEAYGIDTAPLEGFDPAAVKREFGIPEAAEVVALLALGVAARPDRPYPGRFDLGRIVFSERYGNPWPAREGGNGRLRGKRVAILVEEGFEQWELTKPRQALEECGAETELIAPGRETVRGWRHSEWGDTFPVDRDLAHADPAAYDALLLPGGVMNPDKLRRNPGAIRFVRAFFEEEKPVAAICHGPWTLIDAGVVSGRRMTSYDSIQTDLKNAGADWVDAEVVQDGNLVTSRQPSDLPAFCRRMIEVFTGRVEELEAAHEPILVAGS
jgi:protease I